MKTSAIRPHFLHFPSKFTAVEQRITSLAHFSLTLLDLDSIDLKLNSFMTPFSFFWWIFGILGLFWDFILFYHCWWASTLTLMDNFYTSQLTYPTPTHRGTGRTSELHTERPLGWNRTDDLLAVRRQWWPVVIMSVGFERSIQSIIVIFIIQTTKYKIPNNSIAGSCV